MEKLFQTYLQIPIPEIRERILRRLFQRLRSGQGEKVLLDGMAGRPRALNNNLYVARFLLRKQVLNHLVNGILINRDVAESEETRLQMTLGQLIVKLIILSFGEVQSG